MLHNRLHVEVEGQPLFPGELGANMIGTWIELQDFPFPSFYIFQWNDFPDRRRDDFFGPYPIGNQNRGATQNALRDDLSVGLINGGQQGPIRGGE